MKVGHRSHDVAVHTQKMWTLCECLQKGNWKEHLIRHNLFQAYLLECVWQSTFWLDKIFAIFHISETYILIKSLPNKSSVFTELVHFTNVCSFVDMVFATHYWLEGLPLWNAGCSILWVWDGHSVYVVFSRKWPKLKLLSRVNVVNRSELSRFYQVVLSDSL